jgi:hypothetical protein
VYSRDYRGRELNFEASGGLLNSTLVLQDKETDSYWSIIKGEAIEGELKGSPLEELPVARKAKWKDWVKRHPDTLVLSIDGREDEPVNHYEKYMNSDRGFRGMEAVDDRLRTKEEVFAFELGGRQYAVPFQSAEGGAVFEVQDEYLFLYRPYSSEVYRSTTAYLSTAGAFNLVQGIWVHRGSGRRFDTDAEEFLGEDDQSLMRMTGFDTFWYSWSLIHPRTEVLDKPALSAPGR